MPLAPDLTSRLFSMRTGALVWNRAATGAYKAWAWLPALLGLLTCALVAVAQSQYGPAVEPDSVYYYHLAHLYARGELVEAFYSPLYPMLLALGRVVGLPLDWAATCINALAFGLTVGVVALWVRKRGASLFLTVWAGLFCGTSVLAHSASFALTEPVCVALVTLSLFALDALLGGSRRKRLCLAVATGAAAAAGLARIAVAVPLACVLVIFIFLCAGASSWRRRFGIAAVVGACALVPATASFLFWLVDGFAYPWVRVEGIWPRMVGALQGWLLTPAGIGHLEDWIRQVAGPPDAAWLAFSLGVKTALLCVLGLLCGVLAVMTRRYSHPAGVRTFGLIVTFLAVYAGFMVVLLLAMDATLDRRYLAPLYAPGVVAVTLVVQGCVGRARALFVDARAARWRPRRAFVALGWCGALGGLAACQGAKLHHQIVYTYDDVRLQLTQGRGYSARRWRQSETVNFLQESVPAGALIMTEPGTSQAVNYALNRLGSRDGPRGYAVVAAPRGSPEQIRAWFLRRRNPGGETYVVWFHDLRQPGHLYDRDDRPRRLLSWIGTPGLRVLRAFKDGVVLHAPPLDEWRDGDDRVLTASSLKDAILAGVLAGARKLHSGRAFDLYQSNLYSGDGIGNQLIYSFRDCGRLPPGIPVFLHLVPVDAADLPAWRARHDFDNLDHQFADGRRYIYPPCLAIIDLPSSYRVKSIRTGEYDGPLHPM